MISSNNSLSLYTKKSLHLKAFNPYQYMINWELGIKMNLNLSLEDFLERLKHSQTVNLLIILDNMMVILLLFIKFCVQVLGSHFLLIYNQNFHYAGLYLLLLCLKMEGGAYSTPGNGNEIDSKVMQTFQKGFGHV